ncbi:hypothetical protein JCM33374_g819 [Metschnikowia sp. JCM 33374]|nr:hypothetical protein JCM33374_g819 [Metschnikowia sp. JCM 33374]
MSSSLDKSLAPLIKALKNKKKATFFLGAGISTSCGIPDFRSPKTGLYANLKRLNLPYPEAVFDIDYFRDEPKAFYTLCDELYPGKFFPSKFHFLLKIFQDNGLLMRIYTQNIDTMESIVGVHEENIVAAHGLFASNHCIDCAEPMETETLIALMNDKSKNSGIPKCSRCNGYVKPDIVFFGEALPIRFFDTWDEDCDNVEVAIVAGTSLTVYPFAGLPSECRKSSLRVLINNEVVGDFKDKKRKTDMILQQDCDTVADALARGLGWEQQLSELIASEKKKFDEKSKSLLKEHSTLVSEPTNVTTSGNESPDTGDATYATKEMKRLSKELENELGKLSLS